MYPAKPASLERFRGGASPTGPEACRLSSSSAGVERNFVRLSEWDWANRAAVYPSRNGSHKKASIEAPVPAAHCLPADIRFQFRMAGHYARAQERQGIKTEAGVVFACIDV